MQKTVQLLEKAGFEVIFPENMSKLCCGTIWESKGMPELADKKSAELERALLKASDNGTYPVLCDQSPCLYRMRHTIKGVDMYEPVEFILKFVAAPADKAHELHMVKEVGFHPFIPGNLHDAFHKLDRKRHHVRYHLLHRTQGR